MGQSCLNFQVPGALCKVTGKVGKWGIPEKGSQNNQQKLFENTNTPNKSRGLGSFIPARLSSMRHPPLPTTNIENNSNVGIQRYQNNALVGLLIKIDDQMLTDENKV